MINYRPKHRVKVGGQMNELDAGVVGRRLANSALIASVGISVAAIIASVALLLG